MKRLHTIFVAIVVIFDMLPQEIFCCQENLAEGKPTKQSSKKISWDSSDRAVDGNTNADFSAGSCSRTNDKLSGWHWWQVDLLDTYSVRYVNITNRADCCERSLQAFSIEVSEEEPSTLPGFPQTTSASVCITRKDPVPIPGPITYECNQPVEGRYVRLVKESPINSPLLICEFEVYGNSTRPPPNLALGKPTKQSSTDTLHEPIGHAYNAVDGNIDGSFQKASCSHTSETVNHYWHWWQVDLQDTYIISAVRIANRQDCCGEKLRDFVIEASEREPGFLPGFPKTTNATVCLTHKDEIPALEPVMLECDHLIKGRYLRIVKSGYSGLALCEVEVCGKPIKPTKAPGHFWINGKNGLWSFIYIASQESIDVLTLSASTQLMINCARQGVNDRINIYVNPYIHIDLHTGKCRFFKYASDRSAQSISNWVIYMVE